MIDAALGMLRVHLSPVAQLLEECLSLDYHLRPCSAEVRDRLMAIAGEWPALGGYRLPTSHPIRFVRAHTWCPVQVRGC